MNTVTLDQALSSGHGVWRSFTCPVHDDSSPSARVNVQTGKWVCMSCHARGDVQGYVPDPIMELDYAMNLLKGGLDSKSESWLDQYDSGEVHPYWLSRFDEESAKAYRLGYDWAKDKPCYPIRDTSGIPLGVVHRNIDGEGPKYKYPLGVKTTELLFGAHEARQTDVLFVVEGAMDVVAVRQAGFDAVGTYGARLFPKQIEALSGLFPRLVVLAYDMDRAGNEGAQEARNALDKAGLMSFRAYWDDKYKDLGEMDLDTRSSTLSNLLASKYQRV